MKAYWPEVLIFLGYALAADRILALRYRTTILFASPGTTEWIVQTNPFLLAILFLMLGTVPFVVRHRATQRLRIGCDLICAAMLLAIIETLFIRVGTHIPPGWNLQIF